MARRLSKQGLSHFLLFQIIQELEKQRIELLGNILKRYNLQMYSFGQTLKHVRHPDHHRPVHVESLVY